MRNIIKSDLFVPNFPLNRKEHYVESTFSYCLFVCPVQELFTHKETSLLTIRGCKFWPMCSTLMAIEQRGFLTCHTYCVFGPLRSGVDRKHLACEDERSGPKTLGLRRWLLHGASVYNGHLRGPIDTHTYCRVFGSRAVATCFNDGLSRLWFEHPTFRLRGERSNPLRHRRGSTLFW